MYYIEEVNGINTKKRKINRKVGIHCLELWEEAIPYNTDAVISSVI